LIAFGGNPRFCIVNYQFEWTAITVSATMAPLYLSCYGKNTGNQGILATYRENQHFPRCAVNFTDWESKSLSP